MSWGSRESLKLQAQTLQPHSPQLQPGRRPQDRPQALQRGKEQAGRGSWAPSVHGGRVGGASAFPSASVGPLSGLGREGAHGSDRSDGERCEGAQGSAAHEAEGKMVTGSPRQRSACTPAGHVVGLCSLRPSEGALADSRGRQLPSTACHLDRYGQRAFGRREWLVVANGAERPSTRKFTGLSSKVLVVGEQH